METLLKNTFTPIEWEGFTPYSEPPPRKALKEHKQVAVEPKTLVIIPIQGELRCRFIPQKAEAETLFAGLAPGMIGIYQVSFRMPADAGGAPARSAIQAHGSGVGRRGTVVTLARPDFGAQSQPIFFCDAPAVGRRYKGGLPYWPVCRFL